MGHEDAKVVAEVGSCARGSESRAREPSVTDHIACRLRRTGDAQSVNTSNDQHLPDDEQRGAGVSHQRGSEDGGNGLGEEGSFVARSR